MEIFENISEYSYKLFGEIFIENVEILEIISETETTFTFNETMKNYFVNKNVQET